MKIWKSFLLRLPVYLLIAAAIGFGVWQFIKKNVPADAWDAIWQHGDTQPNAQLLPENVIGMGELFEYTPPGAEGTMRCRITDARVVHSAAECPPEALIQEGWFWDETGRIPYENWFTEGGAYDQGCRIVLIELELTNVDAKASVSDGSLGSTDGFFRDPYAFLAYDVIQLADLSKPYEMPDNVDYREYWFSYYSGYGQYAPEDDPDTIGVEPFVVKVEAGQTVCYTLGFLLQGEDGKTVDLPMLRATRGADSDTKTGLFIELELVDG